MQLINTTALARKYAHTTTGIEKRLRSMGVKPVQEVNMPSGRRFVTWDQDLAEQALQHHKAQQEEARRKAFETPPATQEEAEETDTVKAELAEVKALLSQILEVLTHPS